MSTGARFRYLALLLGSKIDRFVQQLHFSDAGVSGRISDLCSIIMTLSLGPLPPLRVTAKVDDWN